MIEESKEPVPYERMPLGKHKEMKMEEVPVDYLLKPAGTFPGRGLRYTVAHFLKNGTM